MALFMLFNSKTECQTTLPLRCYLPHMLSFPPLTVVASHLFLDTDNSWIQASNFQPSYLWSFIFSCVLWMQLKCVGYFFLDKMEAGCFGEQNLTMKNTLLDPLDYQASDSKFTFSYKLINESKATF